MNIRSIPCPGNLLQLGGSQLMNMRLPLRKNRKPNTLTRAYVTGTTMVVDARVRGTFKIPHL